MSFKHMLGTPGTSTSVDFVPGDLAALASHMQHCARSRGSMPGLKSALQTGRAVVAGRLVTMACIGAVLAIVVLAMA